MCGYSITARWDQEPRIKKGRGGGQSALSRTLMADSVYPLKPVWYIKGIDAPYRAVSSDLSPIPSTNSSSVSSFIKDLGYGGLDTALQPSRLPPSSPPHFAIMCAEILHIPELGGTGWIMLLLAEVGKVCKGILFGRHGYGCQSHRHSHGVGHSHHALVHHWRDSYSRHPHGAGHHVWDTHGSWYWASHQGASWRSNRHHAWASTNVHTCKTLWQHRHGLL